MSAGVGLKEGGRRTTIDGFRLEPVGADFSIFVHYNGNIVVVKL
jgi:hypothetical protein